MRLSSFFQRHRSASEAAPVAEAAMPPIDLSGSWRRGSCKHYPLGEETYAVRAQGRMPQVLPAFAVEFALDCIRFQPLAEHAAAYAEKHGWDALQLEALWRTMPALIDAGLLVSTADLERRCMAFFPEEMPATISALGFPTGGDRAPLLERAVSTFAENLRTHGRRADLLVSDNSADPAHGERLRAVLSAVAGKFGLPAFFAGEAEKRRFAAALTRGGACTPEVAEFALFDPLKIGFACGANRNALLLHEAGRMFCATDDDMVCRLTGPPVDSPARLACFADTDPFSRWLFADRESALAAARWVDLDYLGLHESLLGRALGAVAREHADLGMIDFTEAREDFVARVEAGAARVRASFAGHLGDPGIPSSAYFLFYHEENRRRLTTSTAHYRSVFSSRNVLAMMPQPSVGDPSISPGMAMAMDARTLLPPFFPVLHAEDFLWGSTLWQCCPDALLGHVPAAVLHDPPTGKALLPPRDLAARGGVVVFEFAHFLRRVILEWEPPDSADAETRMQLLGRILSEHASLSTSEWAEFTRHHTLNSASEQTEYLTRQLEEAEDAPDFWRRDVEALIAQIRDTLRREDFDVPLELKPARSSAENRHLMQRLTGEYGALLQAWPDIWKLARDLRDSGNGLLQAVLP